MKVAVFSDVQGNLPAMQAVIDDILEWRPDLVILNGDLVNRGPRSLECLKAFETLRRERHWLPVRGNHEDFVLYCRDSQPPSAAEGELRRFTDWTAAQLGAAATALEDWPDHLTFAAPQSDDWVHVTHGTLAGNRDGITAERPDDQLAGRFPADLRLFVTAHTHRPVERWLDGLPILNVGSVGSPFDGDVRASYARLQHYGGRWHWQVQRLSYDRATAERDFHDSGFVEQGGPLARLILEEWRRAALFMVAWNRRFRAAVLAGEIDLARAVDDFLADLD